MSGFQLAKFDPWWARRLGLKMDWQSKPGDRERTYHSANRKVELVVGWRGIARWACEVSQYEDYTSLRLGCPYVQFYRRIGRGKVPPIGEMETSWGFYVYGEKISGSDLVLEWAGRSKRIALNPFRWDGYKRERLRADGEWDSTSHWTPEGKAIDWYVEEHPYAITSVPNYVPGYHEGPKVIINTWEANATCHVERSTRTRRWLPFWRLVEYWVDFHLDDEVGHRKGSWKGGTTGFSEKMLPGDYVSDVVNRAAQNGRGR